jgi:hypothetical protein
MKILNPLDITPGMIEALQVWSEFLKYERNKTDIGVTAAISFLTTAGIGLPTVPIPADAIKDLSILSAMAEKYVTVGTKFVAKYNLFASCYQKVSADWTEKYLNIKLDDNPNAVGTKIDLSPATNVTTTAEFLGSQYDTPLAAFAGEVGALILPNQDPVYGNGPPVNDPNNYDTVPPILDQANTTQEEFDLIGQTSLSDYYVPPQAETAYMGAFDGAHPSGGGD